MELLLVTRAIYPLHGYGGMERHCHDWVQTLSRLGCGIHVVTLPPAEKGVLSTFQKDVSFYFVPGTNPKSVLQRVTTYPAWVWRVHSLVDGLVEQIPFRAIYAQGLAAAGCSGFRVPLIYNPHGMEEFKCKGLKYLAYAHFRSLSSKAALSARKILATDKTLVPEIQTFLNVSDEKITLIPNAVNADEIDVQPAAAPGNHPIFLSVGRLEKNKGFHVLLDALSIAKNMPTDWKAIIVGDGSIR